MKHYDLKVSDVAIMQEAVYDESIQCNKLCGDLHRKAMDEEEEEEDLLSTQALIEAINGHMSIKIVVGSNCITIPNNADFVEALFGYIDGCLEDM